MAAKRKPKPASPSPRSGSDEPTKKGGSEGRGEGQSASPLTKGGPRGVASLLDKGVPRGGPSPLNKGGPRGVRPSALLDTRIIYCGDCLDQLRKLPDTCVDLIYIDPPFNSHRNYEVFWSSLSEPRLLGSGFDLPFEDRHAGTL